MLHPKYKLSYFWKKKWSEDWVDTAHTVLREQWNTYYKPRNDSNTEPSQLDPARDDFFTELNNFGTETTIDELEEYLNTPTISTKGLEPLKWWFEIGDSNPLACMAIDFLSAPSESSFSKH